MPHHGEGPHQDHDDHDHDHDHDHDDHDHDHEHDEEATLKGDEDRQGGWAGVPEALGMPETVATETDAANRPAGPDYGADDRPPRDTAPAEPT